MKSIGIDVLLMNDDGHPHCIDFVHDYRKSADIHTIDWIAKYLDLIRNLISLNCYTIMYKCCAFSLNVSKLTSFIIVHFSTLQLF